MKKLLKIVLIIVLLVGITVILTGCDDKTNETSSTNNTNQEAKPTESDNSSTEKIETTVEESKDIDVESLSNEEKIEHFVHKLLKENYGDKLDSAKIYVDKMYTKEEVEKNETLKSLNVGEKDIPFDVSIHLLPVEGADINEFTVADGVYNKDTGWVSDVHRLGILRYNETDKTYSITNYGTGW